MWLGATLLFGAVVAPAAFTVLRSFGLPNASEIAGSIVTRCLAVVNLSGFLIGLFLLVTIFLRQRIERWRFLFEGFCIVVIVLVTGVGHWVVAARMHALRVAMSIPVDQIRPDDPRRISFDSLHGYSVNLLGLAMIAALVTIILMCVRLNKLKVKD